MQKFFRNSEGSIYQGDKIQDDYELTPDEVTIYLAELNKTNNNSSIQYQLDELDKQTGTTRVMREYLSSVGYKGFNNKVETAETQAVALRAQISK